MSEDEDRSTPRLDHTHYHLYAVGGEESTDDPNRTSISKTFKTTSTAAIAIEDAEEVKSVMADESDSEMSEADASAIHDVLKFVNDNVLQEEDKCLLSVSLEDNLYIVVVQHKEGEAALLGCTRNLKRNQMEVTVVIPIERQSTIELSGDGGFQYHPFCFRKRVYVFRPSSVQSLWTAVQSLFKLLEVARHYDDKDSWKWLEHYDTLRKGSQKQWYYELSRKSHMEELERIRQESLESAALTNASPEQMDEDFEKQVITKLKKMMFESDLDTITSKQLRLGLEEHFGMSLKKYKKTIDQQMIVIMGQMDSASKIFDYLYLGTEFNASNWEELKANNCHYILNVTKEVPCYFIDRIKYHRVRIYDIPEADLLSHWGSTYRFIRHARENGSSVLVHCKMGVSRSASTVMAYCMKQYDWSAQEAYAYVKKKRRIIKPNEGFWGQLDVYEGILRARKHAGSWGKRVGAQHKFHLQKSSEQLLTTADAPESPLTSPPTSPIGSGYSDSDDENPEAPRIKRVTSVRETVSRYERRHQRRSRSKTLDSPPTVKPGSSPRPKRPLSLDAGSIADDEADRNSLIFDDDALPSPLIQESETKELVFKSAGSPFISTKSSQSSVSKPESEADMDLDESSKTEPDSIKETESLSDLMDISITVPELSPRSSSPIEWTFPMATSKSRSLSGPAFVLSPARSNKDDDVRSRTEDSIHQTEMVSRLQSLIEQLETTLEDVSHPPAPTFHHPSQKEFGEWNTVDVSYWLRKTGLEAYQAIFSEHGLTGEDLIDLNNDDLKSIGIQRLHDRKKILRAVSNLRRHSGSSTNTNAAHDESSC